MGVDAHDESIQLASADMDIDVEGDATMFDLFDEMSFPHLHDRELGVVEALIFHNELDAGHGHGFEALGRGEVEAKRLRSGEALIVVFEFLFEFAESWKARFANGGVEFHMNAEILALLRAESFEIIEESRIGHVLGRRLHGANQGGLGMRE